MPEPAVDPSVDDLAARVFQSALGAVELLSIHLGDELGWYDALATGPLTASELAAATSTHERYAHEWLEQQAVFGLLSTDPAEPAEIRAYALTPAFRECVCGPTSLAFLAPLARAFAAAAVQMPSLVQAYRTGGGVSWDQLGDNMRHAQAAMNRPGSSSTSARPWAASRTCTTCSVDRTPGSPMSDADSAGRRSLSHPPIPGPGSTDSTSTSRRSRPPADTLPKPVSTIG
jgi:Rv2258c-like winged HTH domain